MGDHTAELETKRAKVTRPDAALSSSSPPPSSSWSPSSWRTKHIAHQPRYEDVKHLSQVTDQLKSLPPIVQPEEVDDLKRYLGEVAAGKRFILQGGDCAERFVDCRQDRIEAKVKIMLQMSLVLVWGARVPLVRIGRMAGQFMKPRSSDTEVVDGKTVETYKGDSINAFDPADRKPDPERLLKAYFFASTTMNYVRGLMSCGFADLHHPSAWDLSFVRNTDKQRNYREMTERICHALDFMQACGFRDDPSMRQAQLFSSHEGLLLPFEEAMTTTVASEQGGPSRHYNLGAHFLWIGDRTRQLDGAHVEYFRGITNPIGIKVGPTTDPSELVQLIQRLSPSNEPGRITLITRFGVDKVKALLPPVIRAVQGAGLTVVWECDPMHGNTRKVEGSGIKTRSFEDVLNELLHTFDVHAEQGTWLGGVHFEMTGDDVTECTGGSVGVSDDDLSTRYESFCDPRLNYTQSLEMAFLIAKRLSRLQQPSKR
ncbi:3-deoxy-7-phosphoheptulonate synthase [Salpingoeca rosetta]|uniref:Phospho-2-dehydro-3-deoxyheptonate aldolase n=1 Tax=Salpingoeca rosetta (strain ATCC 50818 / BSB-021) TaxID=946362 RepID=F2UCN2_SALR5|nr:3-deoxy-7-phosphoheptulonate synthase [Salpingoeca rosetta]EGD74339.1 3-deoxy-7-phosphoheptulonate synthase [Salpingoeca rosetta]|eukprot:XP_004993239.1 3-deoxy-7-phosphoheptulonate synthase [Salpingoeca rosetta]